MNGFAPSVKRSGAEFPDLQQNGLPLARDLRGYMPGFYVVLRARGVNPVHLKAVLEEVPCS